MWVTMLRKASVILSLLVVGVQFANSAEAVDDKLADQVAEKMADISLAFEHLSSTRHAYVAIATATTIKDGKIQFDESPLLFGNYSACCLAFGWERREKTGC